MKFKVGQSVIALKYAICAEVFKETPGVILEVDYHTPLVQFPYVVQTDGQNEFFGESELRVINCDCPEYLKKI